MFNKQPKNITNHYHNVFRSTTEIDYDKLAKGELKNYRNRPVTDHKDFYFRLMYLRAVRAVDYATTLPLWDGKRILADGSSQGGAQAIAALAFGTESIRKVDKIVGPGNIYVALAKKAVYGHCDIDMLAGPSEILVIADETANPTYLAADLLSQAEHDPLASAILVTDSEAVANAVAEEIEVQLAQLPRQEIASTALANYGKIILASDMATVIEMANISAPEHLEVMTKAPFEILPYIRNAGAIFLGQYSPEPLGDYYAGPNHILPTGGTAKFYSVLNVETFMKKTSIISYTGVALAEVADDVIAMAEAEGLRAHANAIRKRVEGK